MKIEKRVKVYYFSFSNKEDVESTMISFRFLNYLIKLLILIGLLTSCVRKKEKFQYYSIEEILAPYTDSANKRPLKKIVNQIASHPTVDAQSVGISGMQSDQYKRFLWLKQNATEEELIELTESLSANVKVYSFMALCDRNSSFCKQIFEKHISDKSQFYNYAGCIQFPKYVNVFFLNYLSDKLSAKEIDEYRNKLAQQFTEEGWEYIERMNLL